MEQDLRQYYETNYPGQVQLLGADLYNGTAAQLRSFKTQTGATYPLLLQGASATGGNLSTLYGPFDNYVVIDQDGIVRYHAADLHAHGDRYHLNEIRAVVDQYVTPVGVPEPGDRLPGFAMSSAPNPFAGVTRIQFVNPLESSAPARVTVLDPQGRPVARLFEGPVEPGTFAVDWNGAADTGRVTAGAYFIRVELGGYVLSRRVVYLP